MLSLYNTFRNMFSNQEKLAEDLRDACWRKDKAQVQELIKNPNLNPNIPDNRGNTALMFACMYTWEGRHSPLNDVLEIIYILLKHSLIDVNLQNEEGQTALFLACRSSRIHVVSLLLVDNRVDAWIANNVGSTPLDFVAQTSHRKVIEFILLSYQEGNTSKHAAMLFALLILFSDNYLQIKPGNTDNLLARFLRLGSRLPIEMMMVLCNRIAHQAKEIIGTALSEPAFKAFVAIFAAEEFKTNFDSKQAALVPKARVPSTHSPA